MNKRAILWLPAGVLAAACGLQFAYGAEPGLPPMQRAGAISYLSGGVGSDQSSAIKGVMHRYPLVLEFVGKTGTDNEYLADVPVHIADAHGNNLLTTKANGPFMLLSLPHGRYVVSANYNGKTERREVDIEAATRAHEMFVWQM